MTHDHTEGRGRFRTGKTHAVSWWVMAALVVSLALVKHAAATAQEPDVIVFEGERLALNSNPLEAYYRRHPDKWVHPGATVTSNWRGYVAEWRIDGELLKLTAINRRVEAPTPDDPHRRVVRDTLAELFPGKTEVVADWFSGTLAIPRGELVHYVHMGYGSTWESYTLLRVQQGRVVDRRDMSGEAYEEIRGAAIARRMAEREAAARAEASRVARVRASLPPEDSWLEPREAIFDAAAEPVEGIHGTFVIEVRSIGGDRAVFLNSQADYRDPRNLSFQLSRSVAEALEQRLGGSLAEKLHGRQVVVVGGTAKRTRVDFAVDSRPTGKYYYQTRVEVSMPEQVHVL